MLHWKVRKFFFQQHHQPGMKFCAGWNFLCKFFSSRQRKKRMIWKETAFFHSLWDVTVGTQSLKTKPLSYCRTVFRHYFCAANFLLSADTPVVIIGCVPRIVPNPTRSPNRAWVLNMSANLRVESNKNICQHSLTHFLVVILTTEAHFTPFLKQDSNFINAWLKLYKYIEHAYEFKFWHYINLRCSRQHFWPWYCSDNFVFNICQYQVLILGFAEIIFEVRRRWESEASWR